jgi:AbiJ N-terminal domain 4
MTESTPFSQRYNVRRAVPITVRDDAPVAFRSFLFNAIKHFYDHSKDAFDLVHIALGKVPPDLSNRPYSSYPNYWGWTKDAISAAPWYKIYDLVEQFYKKTKPMTAVNSAEYRDLVNTFFEENGYAFRLEANGNLEYRGEESFELAVRTASMALSDASLTTAQTEVHKALEDLAKRPTADLTGAVQHAMAGLECAAKQVAEEPKLELGKIVKRHPDLFPPPLGDVVTQLYGYASNNGRHLTEGGEPNFAEVELVVGIAATTATYLARKAR